MADDNNALPDVGGTSAADPAHDHFSPTIRGIQGLLAAYHWERMLFLAGTVLSFIFATAIGIVMIVSGEVTLANSLPLCGSGGLFVVTGQKTMFYFGKSFDLLRELELARPHG